MVPVKSSSFFPRRLRQNCLEAAVLNMDCNEIIRNLVSKNLLLHVFACLNCLHEFEVYA